MQKESKFLGVLVIAVISCSSPQPISNSLPFEISEESKPADHLWTQKVPGLVTDLSVSKNGKHIVVATVPNPDERRSTKKPEVILYDPDGDRNWRMRMKTKVKDLEIADDGSLVIVSTYDRNLTAISPKGKVEWVYKHLCKPIILSRLKRIICYYDDENKPKTAFDLLDWSGNKLLSFAVDHEVLLMKVSRDEKMILIGLTGGRLIGLDENFKELFRTRVKGELVDADVTGGAAFSGVVLYYVFTIPTKKSEGHRRLASFDKKGKIINEISLGHHTDRVALSGNGQSVYIYGNGPLGQFLGYYPNVFKTQKFDRKWFYRDQHHADFSSSLVVSLNQVLVGFEDVYTTNKQSGKNRRHSHLFSFDPDGDVNWYLPLETEEGAYLYGRGLKSKNRFLAVATDMGFLSGYEVSPAKN